MFIQHYTIRLIENSPYGSLALGSCIIVATMCISNMFVFIKRTVLYITIFDDFYEIHAYIHSFILYLKLLYVKLELTVLCFEILYIDFNENEKVFFILKIRCKKT